MVNGSYTLNIKLTLNIFTLNIYLTYFTNFINL